MFGAGFAIGWIFNKPIPDTEIVEVPGDPYEEIIKKMNDLDENTSIDILKELEKINKLFNVNGFHNYSHNYLGVTCFRESGNLVVDAILNTDLREFLFPGDIITSINGKKISNLTNAEIDDLLYNKPSSTYKVLATSFGEELNMTFYAYEKSSESINFKEIDSSNYYVKFNDLYKGAYIEFNSVLNTIKKNNFDVSGNKLILDLRGVSQGTLSSVTNIAENLMLMEANSLISLKSIAGDKTYQVKGKLKDELNYSIKILVDEKTSNFGTVFAYILANKHQVIGTPTYDYVLYETMNFKSYPLSYSFEAYTWDSANKISANVDFPNLFVQLESFKYEEALLDSVTNSIKCVQLIHKIKGEDIRIDGYFDLSTKTLLESFQSLSLLDVGEFNVLTYKEYLKEYYRLVGNLLKDPMVKEALK